MFIVLAVLTFAFFVTLDVIVRKTQARKLALAGVGAENFELPKGLFFHKGHTWANLDASGKMKVGVDDFAQKILGRFDGFKLRRVGEAVKQGEEIFSVQQGKRTAVFTSPVDGVIRSVNEEVVEDPGVVNEHPYEAGWVYTIEPTNLASNVKRLTSNKDALSWLRSEMRRFRGFLAEQYFQDKLVGQTLQDGGFPVEGLMEHMDDFTWTRFQRISCFHLFGKESSTPFI